ncbi:aspartyl/lysyl-tRNA synthetase [Babesia gibsoni]|uniref:Aspartyl/lysyl-tRNA synthetase n=1 Tax=Babesia gibsoni TaxID=33632 RepID=A0AAD8LSX6_BABGI|nr:aspartyl/lysyl-tRNA synthetase [Babesia gibsoni]
MKLKLGTIGGMLLYKHAAEELRDACCASTAHNGQGYNRLGFLLPSPVEQSTRTHKTPIHVSALPGDTGEHAASSSDGPLRVTCADVAEMQQKIVNGRDIDEVVCTKYGATCASKLFRLFGWVKKVSENRDHSAAYVEIVDGTSHTHAPVVIRSTQRDYVKLTDTDVGDAVTVIGSLDTKPTSNLDQVPQVRILVESDDKGHSFSIHQKERFEHTNPVNINGIYSVEYLREHYNLRVRNAFIQAAFRVRSKVTEMIHKILSDMGFIHVTTPTLTGMNCEGMGDIFKGSDTYLSVSGQLELEALCSGMGKVWKLGPAFRADRSDTPRHLSEFWMLEAEMNDVTLKELISTIDTIIRKSADVVLSFCSGDIEVLQKQTEENIKDRLNVLKNTETKIVTYEDAANILNNARESDPTLEYPLVTLGEPLTAAHERSLLRIMDVPLIAITNFPQSFMPFYMEKAENGTVNNVDMIANGVGEIAGGSLREIRYDVLKRSMEEKAITGSDYEQYLELRKLGNARHGGFGIGFERLLMFLLRIPNIREVIHFPKLRKKHTVD